MQSVGVFMQEASLVPGCPNTRKVTQYILCVDYYDIILGFIIIMPWVLRAPAPVSPFAAFALPIPLFDAAVLQSLGGMEFSRAGAVFLPSWLVPCHDISRPTPVPHMSCHRGDYSCHCHCAPAAYNLQRTVHGNVIAALKHHSVGLVLLCLQERPDSCL